MISPAAIIEYYHAQVEPRRECLVAFHKGDHEAPGMQMCGGTRYSELMLYTQDGDMASLWTGDKHKGHIHPHDGEQFNDPQVYRMVERLVDRYANVGSGPHMDLVLSTVIPVFQGCGYTFWHLPEDPHGEQGIELSDPDAHDVMEMDESLLRRMQRIL